MPHTNDLYREYKDAGLVIIGIHSPNGADTMPQGVKDLAIEYPVAADTSGNTVKAYCVNGYPDYSLIDRAGNLRIIDCANGKVEDAVRFLLAEDVE